MIGRALVFGFWGIAVALGIPSLAQATLIGDTVNFQCTNCNPPTDDDFVVLEGSPELTLFEHLTVDVEDASLRIEWLIDSTNILSDINFVLSDLDWVGVEGAVIGVTIDPTSTWGLSPQVMIGFGPDSVSITNQGDSDVSVGDFLLLNFTVSHVPEPNTLTLTTLGLIGLAAGRRRRN